LQVRSMKICSDHRSLTVRSAKLHIAPSCTGTLPIALCSIGLFAGPRPSVYQRQSAP
jgi:hypothetical protein